MKIIKITIRQLLMFSLLVLIKDVSYAQLQTIKSGLNKVPVYDSTTTNSSVAGYLDKNSFFYANDEFYQSDKSKGWSQLSQPVYGFVKNNSIQNFEKLPLATQKSIVNNSFEKF